MSSIAVSVYVSLFLSVSAYLYLFLYLCLYLSGCIIIHACLARCANCTELYESLLSAYIQEILL